MNMARIVQFDTAGGPEVLELRETDPRSPGPENSASAWTPSA